MLKDVRIPIRPHFGVIGLAPSEADYVDSIPPHWVGGNIDDWRQLGRPRRHPSGAGARTDGGV